jgi:YidC/Oxa1 family membrane protein insertase
MENVASKVIHILLEADHYVHVRPHPRTRQLSSETIDQLENEFSNHPNFDLSEDTTRFEAFFNSHVMISDWSGAAMEFAFGLERPVLFIDMPPKINNSEYTQLESPPIEITYREEIGTVLSPHRLDKLLDALDDLNTNALTYKERIRKLRTSQIFNIGTSAICGAEILANLAEQIEHHPQSPMI